MKKRTLLLVVMVALSIFLLTACGGTSSNSADNAATEMSNFKVIEGKEYLAYSLDTRVVYYMFSTNKKSGYHGYGYSYFAPYVSENGRFCRYINDEIVEIIVENANN